MPVLRETDLDYVNQHWDDVEREDEPTPTQDEIDADELREQYDEARFRY